MYDTLVKERGSGMNIKGYRVSANLSQSDVAKRLNMHRETYRRKENKERKFTLEEAVSLSKLFGISLQEFFEATKA